MKVMIEKNLEVFTEVMDKLISKTCTEVTFILDSEGMVLKTFGQANSTFVKFFMKKEAFDSFDLLGKDKVTLSISVDLLKDVLKTCKKSIELIMQDDRLFLNTEKKKFTSGILDLEVTDKDPDLSFGTKIKARTNDILKMLKDIKIIKANEIVLDVREGKLVGRAKEGVKTAEINIEAEVEGNDVSSSYSRDLMEPLVSFKTCFNDVLIELDPDQPLLLKYNTENIFLTIILAPRVKE